MRALVQRVTRASVDVEGERIAEIGPGSLVLVGVTHDDTEADAVRLAAKVARLRIFDDDDGVMNRSTLDLGRPLCVVSQFTLYGDAAKGNRPSWLAAARPEVAEPLIARMIDELRTLGCPVATGRFRADMAVSLVNDGPVTLLIEV